MSNKEKILQLIESAKSEIPTDLVKDLPVSELTGYPQKHSFEYNIWGIGEKIRPLLIEEPKLRSNIEIQKGILSICMDKRAKKGRESFVMLMGSVKFAKYASEIASLVNDSDVSGHAINTLVKMKQPGFFQEVAPHKESKIAWVRNAAKKYCEKYGGL